MTSKQSSMSSIEPIDPVPAGVGATLGDNPCSPDDDSSKAIRIALQLEARDLPNLDTRGKSDPFVIVYRKSDTSTSTTEKWDKIGQTDTVYNNLNPKWSTTFTVEYRFGATTVLRFSIYDRDSKDEDLSKHDYIGEVACTIAQVVLADNQRLVSQINNKKAKPGTRTGTLTIRAEEQQGDLGDNVTLQFAVTGLRRGRKPFYVLSNKNRNDEEFSPVVYSEVHKAYAGAHHVTTFKPITTSLARLTNGDMDRELEVQFMDYDRLGSHYRGGSVRFTLRAAKAVVANAAPARFALRKKKSNGVVVEAGELILNKCEIAVPFSFIDYIRSGIEINTMIAIDMSNTNGNPLDPRSLHYMHGENEYIIALREVGSVLAAYDTTKNFPAFGFGATQPPWYDETAHCFPLNGQNGQSVCNEIKGVIDGYKKALQTVGPFEPCRYGPVLKHVIEMTRRANARHGSIAYTILLLFTDGDFVDLPDVANLICDGAELPLSIVIVGVGNSRFLKLERLDGDNERLCSTEGIPCARDIVQFVQFHKHRYNPTQLAREVLDEVPEQLVSYMRSKGLKPSDIKPIRKPRLSPPATENVPYLPESVLQNIPSSNSYQPAPETTHIPEITPPPYHGQPAVSVQHTSHFTPAVPASVTGVPAPMSGFTQSAIPLYAASGLQPQANEQKLNSVPCSGTELTSPSSNLNRPPAPSQGTQESFMSCQPTIRLHGLHPLHPYNLQVDMQDSTKYGVMQYPPSQYPGGYGDQVHVQNQPSNLLQQPHQPQYQQPIQQLHHQPPEYHRPQPHHPQQQNRPQHYPPQSYSYLYPNGQYGSTYSQAPHPDLANTYSPYSVPLAQNYQHPPGSMPTPPTELPFQSQYSRPNYPSR